MRFPVKDGRLRLRSLEFLLAETCNLRCAHCVSASPFLAAPHFPRLDEFEESLSILSGVAHARQIKFLGGEPLLNAQLPRFVAAARGSGMFDKIRVTTNGLLLERLDANVLAGVDIIEVSRYPDASERLSDAVLRGLLSGALEKGSSLEIVDRPQFAVALSDGPSPDSALTQRIYDECDEPIWCPTLSGRRIYRCSRVVTLDRYLTQIGAAHPDLSSGDGFPLEESADLRERLGAYLESSTPLLSCSYCYGMSGRARPGAQLAGEVVREKKSGRGFEPFDVDMVMPPRRRPWYRPFDVDISMPARRGPWYKGVAKWLKDRWGAF